ncbi:hypothetical protein NP233_g7947 [Leucocoprinus birnbaumii]|uniref:Uncharacterized protein n=1 Tax=Leucocoprinus birnbaumii TaxID=56174 RepID=A0AAD5YU62_9AGAR|nr:hypothetical protein NP233_g7947 [Leucocoprinus birnbaumii]
MEGDDVMGDVGLDRAVSEETEGTSGNYREDFAVDRLEIEACLAEESVVDEISSSVDAAQESPNSVDEQIDPKAVGLDNAALSTSPSSKDEHALIAVAEVGAIYTAPIPANVHATTTRSPLLIAQLHLRTRPPVIPALSMLPPHPSSPSPPFSLTLEPIAVSSGSQAPKHSTATPSS